MGYRTAMGWRVRLLGAVALTLLMACDGGADTAPAPLVGPDGLDPARLRTVLGHEFEPDHFDLDGLPERGMLRVLVGYSRTHYFMDGLNIRGLTAENLKRFDPYLQAKLDHPKPRVHLLPIPVARDEMIDFLVDGRGDMAMGNITITPERAARVDFSIPILSDVAELIVHGPNVTGLATLSDLSGRVVHVRASSSFRESLEELNERFAAQGLEPVEVVALDEHLQSEDVLELVNAGAIGITVIDSHIGKFWAGVLPNIVIREDLALRTGREIGWAIRKDLAGMKPIVDEFVRRHREGTLVGNVLLKRYLKNNEYVHNARASADRQRFVAMADLFRRFSREYDFDWLLIAAQAYQESRLIQSRRSPAGAIGVMQLLPATALSPPIGIPNIDDLEANIHAGHKYLRYIADTYLDDPGIDELNRHLLAFAAYNAGPTRLRQMRRDAVRRGLDPNQWFGNVERVAAEEVGREPVIYVRNIFKYYVTYKLMEAEGELSSS